MREARADSPARSVSSLRLVTIEPGERAHLVPLDANLLERSEAMLGVMTVIEDGVVSARPKRTTR